MTPTTARATTPPAVSKVFVVDDHPIVRQGLALLLNAQPDLEVCGEAGDVQAALAALECVTPDILLVEISLNGPDGLELVKAVRARSSALPMLVLSMHDESIYAERALRAGANGYIMKREATERVLVAIRQILRGDVYLSDRVANRMVRQYAKGPVDETRPALATLSDRELEVFRLVGVGHSTRDIAGELHLSVKTVETHQAHIKEKLSLHSARELVQYAIEWHLTEAASGNARS
jgi:DNA-binding NarL/FixJ family response regulator